MESLGGLQLAGELLGRAVAERFVESKLVAVAPPIFDDKPCIRERTGLVFAEAPPRKPPLNDSMQAFWVGFPGSMERTALADREPNAPSRCLIVLCRVHYEILREAAGHSVTLEHAGHANAAALVLPRSLSPSYCTS